MTNHRKYSKPRVDMIFRRNLGGIGQNLILHRPDFQDWLNGKKPSGSRMTVSSFREHAVSSHIAHIYLYPFATNVSCVLTIHNST